MQAIRRFFARPKRGHESDEDGMKGHGTGPIPEVSDEVQEMRHRAEMVLRQAEEVYGDALTVTERIEAMKNGRDFIAEALLATRRGGSAA